MKQKETIKPLRIHKRNIKQKEQPFPKRNNHFLRDHPFRHKRKIV